MGANACVRRNLVMTSNLVLGTNVNLPKISPFIIMRVYKERYNSPHMTSDAACGILPLRNSADSHCIGAVTGLLHVRRT